MKRTLRQTALPLLTAMIWGAAFTAQSVCGEYLGAFSINALRFFIAFLCLLPVCLFRKNRGAWKDILPGSIVSGAALFAASNAQQFGLAQGAQAGKAGFITALYIVLVPLAAVFTKKNRRVVSGWRWRSRLRACIFCALRAGSPLRHPICGCWPARRSLPCRS